MTELRKTILDLIAANKVGKAIETLRASEIVSSNNRINSQITMLSSRYKSMREDSIKGILSASEKTLAEAKINNDILELLQNLENPPSNLISNSVAQKSKINSLIGLGGLLLVVLIAFFVWNQMDENQEVSHPGEAAAETPEIKEPEPVLLPRKFKIEPKDIQIANGNDGSGGDPEIYGWVKMGVGKKGQRNNLKTIFNRPKSSYLTMKDGVSYPMDATGEFLEIEVSPEGKEYLLDQYEFFLSADLTESDDGGVFDPDDRIGSGQVVKSLRDLASGESQTFSLRINSPEGNVTISTTVSEVKN